MPRPDYIVVTGTSAGGLKALTEFVTYVNPEMNAAIFIVMHLSATSLSDFLLLKLQPHTSFTVAVASEGMPIERGHIYIAPANGHLLVNENNMQIGSANWFAG